MAEEEKKEGIVDGAKPEEGIYKVDNGAKSELSKEEIETKVKIDLIKKILDDKPSTQLGEGVQVVEANDPIVEDDPVKVETPKVIQPTETNNSEKKDYKELLKKSGIVAGIIFGIFIFLFIGVKLSKFPTADGVGSATDVLDVEEDKGDNVKIVEPIVEDKKDDAVEDSEIIESDTKEKEDSLENKDSITDKISGFFNGLLQEETDKAKDKAVEGVFSIKDKFLSGLTGLIGLEETENEIEEDIEEE